MSGRPRLVAEGTPIYGPGSTTHSDDEDSISSPMQVCKPYVIGSHEQQQENGGGVAKKRSSLQEAAAALPSSSNAADAATKGYCSLGPNPSSSLQAAAAAVRATGGSPRHYTPRSKNKGGALASSFVIGETPKNGNNPNSDHGSNVEYMEGVEVHHPSAPPFGNTDDMDHEFIVERRSYTSANGPIQPSYVVGGDGGSNSYTNGEKNNLHAPIAGRIDRMEGVIDQSTKVPLVVLDGANVAYAYATAIVSMHQNYGSYPASTSGTFGNNKGKVQPDLRGIQVAANYFLAANLRVLIVLPAPWFRSKPRTDDTNRGNAKMETEDLEILHDLKAKGLLVESPPADDDDAYALTIAQREHSRSQQRNGEGTGYVLSNDMFRDAMSRDEIGNLREWLIQGPGRISFTFADLGTMDDHGDRILDFLPNPRHPRVVWVERHHRSNAT